jgi:hypothetical protein
VNHQKRRRLAAEVNVGGRFAKFSQSNLIELGNLELGLYVFQQRLAF